jgi:hypothetical protein
MGIKKREKKKKKKKSTLTFPAIVGETVTRDTIIKMVPARVGDEGRTSVVKSLMGSHPHWLEVLGEELVHLRLCSLCPKR